MASAEQDEWIGRVLGISMHAENASAATAAEDRTEDVLAIWSDAKDAVDAQLNRLAMELRAHGDPDFDQVADRGLYGVGSGRETVTLTASLRDYASAPPAQRNVTAAALLGAVNAYRTMLAASTTVELVDDNPFGVDVMMYGTMDRALTRISSAVGR